MAEVKQASPSGLVSFETGSELSFSVHLTSLQASEAQPQDQGIEGVLELHHQAGKKSEPTSSDDHVEVHEDDAKESKLNPVELDGSKSGQKANSTSRITSNTPGNVKSGVDCQQRSSCQHNVFEKKLRLQNNSTCEAPVRSEFNQEVQRQETSEPHSSNSCSLKPLVELVNNQALQVKAQTAGYGEYKGVDGLAPVAKAERIHRKDNLTAVQTATKAQHFENERENCSLKKNDNSTRNLREGPLGDSFTANEKFGNHPYSVLHSARGSYPLAPARVYASPSNNYQFEGDSESWTEQSFSFQKGQPGGGHDVSNQVSSQLISVVLKLQKKCEFLEQEVHAVFRHQATMQRVLELESEHDSLKQEMGRQLNQLNTYKNQNGALSCRVFDLEVCSLYFFWH